jgi:hypothetical protein
MAVGQIVRMALGVFRHTIFFRFTAKPSKPQIACRVRSNPLERADQSVQLMKFKGEKWELFGDAISADLDG